MFRRLEQWQLTQRIIGGSEVRFLYLQLIHWCGIMVLLWSPKPAMRVRFLPPLPYRDVTQFGQSNCLIRSKSQVQVLLSLLYQQLKGKAPHCECGRYEFKSHLAPQYTVVAQLVSAVVLYTRGSRFKSQLQYYYSRVAQWSLGWFQTTMSCPPQVSS